MDQELICICGNIEYWQFYYEFTCPVCSRKYKRSEIIPTENTQYWYSEFNSETQTYGDWISI